jgi:type II secretory pathway component GspD/PulD (secretin)
MLPYTSTIQEIETISIQTAVPGLGGDDGEGDGGQVVTTPLNLPTQSQRRLAATVCVPDQGTLLLGGLATVQRDEMTEGVPVLNKIPVLKRLFAARGDRSQRNHLLVLVQPNIIMLSERAP